MQLASIADLVVSVNYIYIVHTSHMMLTGTSPGLQPHGPETPTKQRYSKKLPSRELP